MRYKHLFLFLVLGLFVGCDDFTLKRTATVRSLTGEIRFDPETSQVMMTLYYDMVNLRRRPLRDVYFYTHESVMIDAAYDRDTLLRMERGVAIGASTKVYRVRVSEWLPHTRRRLRLHVRIAGPIETTGFFLSPEGVYFDSEKIWVPVCFDDIPSFRYRLTVKTPEPYRALLGGKMLQEVVSNGMVISEWQAESTNIFLTGNLLIRRFSRVGNESLSLYLPQAVSGFSERRLATLLEILQEGHNVLERHVGEYPFSQIRIAFAPRRMVPLDQFTDGLFLANMIILEEGMVSNLLPARRGVLDSVLLSEDSWLYVMKVIFHEMAHAYLGHDLRWENEELLPIESLTEVTSLKILEWVSPETYRLALNRLRYGWHQARLSESSLHTMYLYRNLLMATTLSPRSYFRLLRDLRKRYLYSGVDTRGLLQTLFYLEQTNSFTLVWKQWDDMPRWGMGLSVTNGGFVLSHDYPFSLPVTLTVENNNVVTNVALEVGRDSSLFVPWRRFDSVVLDSPLQWLDTSVGNDVFDPEISAVVSNIQMYYRGVTNLTIGIGEMDTRERWRSPVEDRFLTIVAFPEVEIVYHRHEVREERLFIYAYKKQGERRRTYALFTLYRDGERWVWDGIYDGALSYSTYSP